VINEGKTIKIKLRKSRKRFGSKEKIVLSLHPQRMDIVVRETKEGVH